MAGDINPNNRLNRDRRMLLGSMAALAFTPIVGGCSSPQQRKPQKTVLIPLAEPSDVELPALGGDPASVFPASVASGDPTPSGAIIWTRIADATLNRGEPILWQIANDIDFTDPVIGGEVSTTSVSSNNDNALKLDLDGLLEPNRFYYYRFAHNGVSSRPGRLRTLPTTDADVESLKLLVASCQDYTLAYFHAFGEMAEREADYVLHLGDFIYESSIVPARPIALPSGSQYASSREDLLTIYRAHRTDENLRLLLENHTLINTFDDHEFANDLYFDGDRPRGPDHPLDGDAAAMTQYVRDALDVWFHYLPVRVSYSPEANFPDVMDIQRSFRFGNLVELAVTELRMHRSPHPCGEGNFGERQLVVKSSCEARHETQRTLLGVEQKQWFIDTLRNTNAQWRVAALPIPLSPIDIAQAPPSFYEADHWDGYTVERAELLSALNGSNNLVVLGADLHAFGAATLLDGYPNGPAVGTEFATSCAAATPIASINPPANAFLQNANILANNPHFTFWDGTRNGWLEVVFTKTQCSVAVRAMQAQTPTPNQSIELAVFNVADGSATITESAVA
jgi:alkaline phosphatase D